MEKIETILTNCITEIRSGRATLAECLDRYPSSRSELESLLKIVLNIQEPPGLNLDSSYKQAAKARLLRQIGATRQKKSRSFADILSFGLPPRLVWARVAVSVLAVIIVISMLAGGTVYAAQGSLPGDLLYPVKIGAEDARLLITGDSSAKVQLNLKFAQTRLVEMNELANGDQEKVVLAVEGYKGNLYAAGQQIRRITDISTLPDLLVGALEDIQKQIVFCDSVIDSNPACLGPVSEAGTMAVNQQVEFLEMLTQQDILRAAQINLNSMQNRLQRAQATANANQYQAMQEALFQYQQFNQLGKHILRSAQASNNHNSEIEALCLQMLSGHLDILNSISKLVPQEYQNQIEACRQTAMESQTQARYGSQMQSTHGDEGSSGSGDDSGSGGDGSSGSGGDSGSGGGGSGNGGGSDSGGGDGSDSGKN